YIYNCIANIIENEKAEKDQIVLSFKIVVQLEDESIIEKCLHDIADSVVAEIE
ncbi:4519_t:CDS:1, partial [Ambispora gerdemannii]